MMSVLFLADINRQARVWFLVGPNTRRWYRAPLTAVRPDVGALDSLPGSQRYACSRNSTGTPRLSELLTVEMSRVRRMMLSTSVDLSAASTATRIFA